MLYIISKFYKTYKSDLIECIKLNTEALQNFYSQEYILKFTDVELNGFI